MVSPFWHDTGSLTKNSTEIIDIVAKKKKKLTSIGTFIYEKPFDSY